MKSRDSENYLYTAVHHRIIHQELEAAHMPRDGGKGYKGWPIHSNGVLLGLEREGNSDAC